MASAVALAALLQKAAAGPENRYKDYEILESFSGFITAAIGDHNCICGACCEAIKIVPEYHQPELPVLAPVLDLRWTLMSYC